ncbi:MAG: phosphoglycerate dehydrogenase, partial [Planctomycetota bacterium]
MAETSFDKGKMEVLLLEGVHPNAEARFSAAGYSNVQHMPHALPTPELLHAMSTAHLVGIRSGTQLTKDVLDVATRLIGIGCFCIGTNQVDLDAARRCGVPVFNAPYSNTRSVAELVLAEAILLLRGVPAKHDLLRKGTWKKSAHNAYEIRGKTLGVIGYGNIGSQLGVLAESMGMHVLYHDVVPKLKLGNARATSTLSELFEQSDVVSLHVPATVDTANLIGRDELRAMRQGAVLINASRGNVVDVEALAESINSGHLLGAAIDVYPEEPKSNDDGSTFSTPLHACENVLLTPHIGGSTQEAQANIAEEVAEKLILWSDNGSTLSAVNFPEVALPAHPGKHRVLHIHRNEPGMLSRINTMFSETGANIAAQYLQTHADVGYVVIDLDAASSGDVMNRLRVIDGT